MGMAGMERLCDCNVLLSYSLAVGHTAISAELFSIVWREGNHLAGLAP